MRILFLDQFNQPGGAQECLLDLLPAVLERGWEACVMLPGSGPMSDRMNRLGIEVLPVSCGPYSSGRKTARDLARFITDVPLAARQIARVCEARSVDAIYVNGPRLMPAVALARVANKPVVFHCHSLLAPKYLEWISGISLRLTRARVLASSNFVAGPLRKWIPVDRMTVVYNGVCGGGERIKRNGHARVGIIGRIAPEKGLDTFLSVVRILHGDLPDCRFVISGAALFSGRAYEEDIRRRADELPVEFTGWTDDVPNVLAGLDLLVVSSTPVDATPRVILQAFAAKTPVAAFANDGFRELIDDGKTGFLVESRTPEALASKIKDLLLGDAGRLNAVAEAAWISWRERFSLETYRGRIIRVLEEMA